MNPPEAKRPRLSSGGGGGGANTSDGTNFIASDIPPRPDHADCVVSSSRLTTSSTDTDINTNVNVNVTATTNLAVFTYNTPPNSDNIEFALHTIGDTTKKKKNPYTKHIVLQSLQDLIRWSASLDREFYSEFFELAGISRIVKFLMVPSNMRDMDYVYLACRIIVSCTCIGPNGENMDIAQVMAKKFIERGGVHIMLLANEEYDGSSGDKELRALYYIWLVLYNVVSNRTTALDEIERDQQLHILNDTIATLRLLNNGVNNQTWVHLIIRQVFFVLRYLIRPNTKLIPGDFEGNNNDNNIFQTFVDAMKDSNRQWAFIEKKWSVASRFFIAYFMRTFSTFPSENNNDLKFVISFYVKYITIEPNNAFIHHAFKFLGRATVVIGKVEMKETPGLMSCLAAIIDPSMRNNNGTNIEAVTENAATTLMKKLL